MIRVGIGGWIFEPWRGTFFPKGLPKTRELHHASRAVTTIEINSTYYSAQKPETFRKWAEQTPDDFVFAVKASRFATNRRVLAEAGLSVERFVTQGITELKKKLGPNPLAVRADQEIRRGGFRSLPEAAAEGA